MKVVLDTNVIVSAFLSAEGKPAMILRHVLQRDISIFINSSIVIEYEQVLSRPKFARRIDYPAIQRFFDVLYTIGIVVDAQPSIIELPDEADRKFYDVALAAGAILVTGNKRHYPSETFIVDPAEFMDTFRSG